MPSNSPSPDQLPLNLPEQEAILFGVTGSGKVAYYDTRHNELIIGHYDEETDELVPTITFATHGIADAVQQFIDLPTTIQPSIIFEAFEDADESYDEPYLAALIETGFTAEDVAAILPVTEAQANAVAAEVQGDVSEE